MKKKLPTIYKAVRTALGWKKHQMYKLLEIERQAYEALEKSVDRPDPEKLAKLRRAIKWSYSKFYGLFEELHG